MQGNANATPFIRGSLPEAVAAVAAREDSKLVVLVQLCLPESRARWAADLAFTRMETNPRGPFGCVMANELLAPVPA